MKTKTPMYQPAHSSGYTLIEIMTAVAILAIVAAVAIPSYTGYIATSRQNAARANVEPLRLALEDHWLDNGTYVAGDWDPVTDDYTLQTGALGWRPDGDDGDFTYNVAISGTDSFTITVNHLDGGTARVCKPGPCP